MPWQCPELHLCVFTNIHGSMIDNLARLWSWIARLASDRARDMAYLFDGIDDYIEQSPYSMGVAIKQSDGLWWYWQCYNGGINLWVQTWLDNRAVQTIKIRWTVDTLAAWSILFSYWSSSVWYLTISIKTDGKIQVETQGTGSWRVTSTNAITINSEFNIVVKVNNTLPTWTARVVWDVDIFINWWAKEIKTFASIWNNTSTLTSARWWAYSNTLMHYGKMRSISIWNTALSDAECTAESNSSTVLQISWLVGTWDTNNTSMALWRTWYSLNVSGNIKTGSDADGSYIDINWNKDFTAGIWTAAQAAITSWPSYTQAHSFSVCVRLKMISAPPNNNNWIFASWFDAWIDCNGSSFKFWIRSWWTTNQVTYSYTLNTLYDLHLVYDSNTQKFYAYVDWVLQNSWWTAIPGNFTTLDWWLGDNGLLAGNNSSGRKYIYHARIYQRALSQADVTADRALWNTVPTDLSIVSEYRPENLQYNRQYAQQVAYSNAAYTKWSGTTITDAVSTIYGVTADEVARTWWSIAASKVNQDITILSWSLMASKTWVVKVHVKVASWTALFRIRCTHLWVADYYSSNMTATVDDNEFTFSQAFTSSTSGSAVQVWIVCDSWNTAATLIVSRQIDVYVTNQVLFDDSPNLGDLIGRKTNVVLSAFVKPNIDSANNQNAQTILMVPWLYMHLRWSTNDINVRCDTKIAARTAWVISLWNWFRGIVHITWYKYRDWSVWRVKLYKDWILQWWTQTVISVDPGDNSIYNIQAVAWKFSSTLLSWYSWDMRGYKVATYTDFTDADALAISKRGEPANATKFIWRRPRAYEAWLISADLSGNGRVWRLRNGVQRVAVPAS